MRKVHPCGLVLLAPFQNAYPKMDLDMHPL